MNVWCRTVGKEDDRVVTADKYRGIRQAFWAEDSKTLLFMQDDAGDENFHLFAIDATSASSAARDLTPYKGAKVQNQYSYYLTTERLPPTASVPPYRDSTATTARLPGAERHHEQALPRPAARGHQQPRPGKVSRKVVGAVR